MGGSRRKIKRSRAKVKVGLPRKKPREFKPAFDLPEALAAAAAAEGGGHAPSWDAEGSVVKNYAAFGVVANPNLLGAHARGTPRLVQSAPLQAPDIDAARAPVDEFEPVDSGSDLESDGQSSPGSPFHSLVPALWKLIASCLNHICGWVWFVGYDAGVYSISVELWTIVFKWLKRAVWWGHYENMLIWI